MLTNYEQQFGVVCADITNKISRSVNLADKSQAIMNIDGLFQEAREIIEQMELETLITANLAVVRNKALSF